MRNVTRHVLTALTAGVAAALPLALVFSGPASASTLTSSDGTVALTTTNSTGTPAPGTPYSAGQTVNIAVTMNPTMNQASLETAGYPSGAVAIKALECVDPNGDSNDLPTKPSECDADTLDSISGANTDGSMNINGYTVYALPDQGGALGATTLNCGVAPNYCVIGLFANYSDFSKPHIFSAPFQILANTDDGGENPGDGTPEVPFAIALPLAAAAVGGGTLFLRRRKQHRAA